jgi:Right handed beta helix region
MNPSTVILSICRFTRFRGGAVYSVCEAKDTVRGIKGSEFLMQDCKIEEGAITGIYLAGPGAKQVILRNKIANVRGIGIRVHKGNKSKIKGCEIKKCLTGIEILSADPTILFSSIKNCWENGILSIAKEGLRCDGLVKMSWIT